MNQIYGFEGEVKAKYTAQMYELFSEVFEWLPLAQCINGKVLVRQAPYPATTRGCEAEGGVWPAPLLTLLFPPEPQIMHGGLFSEDGVTLDDIRKIERSRQPPDSGDRVAGDSPTFLSCMLGPCTSPRGAALAREQKCAAVIHLTPSRDLPGSPVVWTPCFHCRGLGSIPGWELESGVL